MSAQDRTWRIGELARETGLTVRTMHHYDQLGLLSPRSRTDGGHRCYTSGDVRRLHRIVALRSLGISLEQIGTLLDGQPDPTGLLRSQLDAVEELIRNATSLRARLLDVLGNLGTLRRAAPATHRRDRGRERVNDTRAVRGTQRKATTAGTRTERGGPVPDITLRPRADPAAGS
jgi:DNA-binding transcriptional MerR regulator